jgi:hypothetical protein
MWKIKSPSQPIFHLIIGCEGQIMGYEGQIMGCEGQIMGYEGK